MNTLDDKWAEYRHAALAEARTLQVLLAHQAFYMGALAILRALSEAERFGEQRGRTHDRLMREISVHMAQAQAAVQLAQDVADKER